MRPPAAIITGASQGIGAGLVAGYRSAGYAVVGVALSFPSADRDESDYVAVVGDIADARTARRAVDQARDHFGRIDTLINNAGIYIGKPFMEYTFDEYAAITAVNLTGFFHVTQLAIAEMVARGGGHVVNVSTSLVDRGQHEAVCATCPYQGRTRRGQPFPGDRIRLARGLGWPDASHRAIHNSTAELWETAGRPAPGSRPREGEVIAHFASGEQTVRYEPAPPMVGTTGEIEALSLWAGQSVALAKQSQPAAEIVTELVAMVPATSTSEPGG